MNIIWLIIFTLILVIIIKKYKEPQSEKYQTRPYMAQNCPLDGILDSVSTVSENVVDLDQDTIGNVADVALKLGCSEPQTKVTLDYNGVSLDLVSSGQKETWIKKLGGGERKKVTVYPIDLDRMLPLLVMNKPTKNQFISVDTDDKHLKALIGVFDQNTRLNIINQAWDCVDIEGTTFPIS